MSRKRSLILLAISLAAVAFSGIALYALQESQKYAMQEDQKMDLYSLYWTCQTNDARFDCAIVRYRSTQKICGVYIAQEPQTRSTFHAKPKWLDIHQTSFPWRMTAKVDGKTISFRPDFVSVHCTDLTGHAFSRDFPAVGFHYIKDGPPFAGDIANSVDVPAIFAACTSNGDEDERTDGHQAADQPK